MRNFKHDYQDATENVDQAVALMPRKLLIKEQGIAKKLAKSSQPDINKLKKIYRLSDELYSRFDDITHCQKGCSHCCHYNVDVLDIEAQLIEQVYGLKKSAGKNVSKKPRQNFQGQPCSFLKNGACSIYQARPFMCRKYVSFMPSEHWCAPAISETREMPHIAFSELNLAYATFIEHHETRDIRQWFPNTVKSDNSPNTSKARCDQIAVVEL